MRYVALGGLIGCAVLVAAMLVPARETTRRDLPPLIRHALSADGRAELALAARTSSVFVFDERLWPAEPWAPAARDATESGRWAGSGAGVATVVLPGPGPGPLPVAIAVTRAEPRVRAGDDHVVDLDVLVDSGRLVLVGTGSITAHSVAVPPGRYRLRFAGEGYRVARGADRLRIELWPREGEQPPRVRRRWAGWTP
jgi:hypothetical protein